MTSQSFNSEQHKHTTDQKAAADQSNTLLSSFDDQRPDTIAQAKTIDGINNSPKSIAQRQEQEQLFGNKDLAQAKMEEEDLLQGKFEAKPIQMDLEEEDLLQGKFASNTPVQKKSSNGIPEDVHSKLTATMGTDFSNVNVHTNSNQATQLNALAYTQGNDVHFAPGQFKPNTSQGQQLIGHEFAHVVQQAEGKVKPTVEVNGMPVNDDVGLESDADRIGDEVARM